MTGDPVPGAALSLPLSYLVAAPLFGVWDTLSLLTLSQHYAVLLTLIGLYLVRRVLAPKRDARWPTRIALEALRGLAALVALLAFYAAGVFLPRPMVGLTVDDPDLVKIDFHSHTRFSHDGWSAFTAARNRAWHEAGGFDVAYITDHYTWQGIDAAEPDNPARAGERTVMLEGAEIRIHRRPTNVLGDRSRYLFALDGDSLYMEPDSLRRRGGTAPPPTLLYTMPGHLQYVVPFTEDEPSGVIGIEIVDGSPRGLEQVRRERERIVTLADSADLALIAAANLHGWGRTVAGWSLMRLPGWQNETPRALGARIEAKIHAERRDAGTVVVRRMPYHDGSSVALALTAPWLAWEHLRMLSWTERLSWLLWLALVAAVHLRRARIAPTGEPGAA